MGSFLGKIKKALSGGGGEGEAAGPSAEYKGFTITAAPRREGGQWLTAGVIAKEIDGEMKEHQFIRADRHGSKDGAESFSLDKARQIVDEQGERLFQD